MYEITDRNLETIATARNYELALALTVALGAFAIVHPARNVR